MITKPSARTAPEVLLRSGLEKTFGLTDHPKRDLLWRKAWERGSASGLGGVENEYRDLAELVPAESETDRLRSEVTRLTAALASADSVWSTTCEQQAQRIAQLERAMPRETSESIAAWQNETFGKATTTFSRISRSSQAIFSAMAKASGADLKVARPNLSRAIRAAEELAELIEMLVIDDNDPGAPVEAVDTGICLEGIIAAHGQERSVVADTKMSINRTRTWQMTGDGHGQHVPDESADG